MPNSSRPSRIPSTNATPNSRNGSATTSIPTPTTPKGSPRKFPPSPKLGLGSPPANARDAANPRPSPDAYAKPTLPTKPTLLGPNLPSSWAELDDFVRGQIAETAIFVPNYLE